MARNPLTRTEREDIRAGIAAGDNNAQIAAGLNRSASCVGKEIGRNGGRHAYRADLAQQRADRQRYRPRATLLQRDQKLAAHVTARLNAQDSPMTISIELQRGTHGVVGSISHETIYRAIQQPDRGLPAGIHRCLHLKRRRRRHRNRPTPASTRHPLGVFASIRNRPAIAWRRTEPGHLEGDLIVGAMNRSAMITIFDRYSRHLWLCRLTTGKGKDGLYRGVKRTLARMPLVFQKTLTWDQGSEMARHAELADKAGIDIYFADPQSPWQRPTNENGNALIRRYVGKSTDLSQYSTRQIRCIEHRINTIPRRSLNWATAKDLYTHQLSMTG